MTSSTLLLGIRTFAERWRSFRRSRCFDFFFSNFDNDSNLLTSFTLLRPKSIRVTRFRIWWPAVLPVFVWVFSWYSCSVYRYSLYTKKKLLDGLFKCRPATRKWILFDRLAFRTWQFEIAFQLLKLLSNFEIRALFVHRIYRISRPF